LEKAEFDTREKNQKGQMHYRPQHDAKALTSNYYNFEDDPSSEYGQQNCCEEAKTVLEGRPGEVDSVTHGNRPMLHLPRPPIFANGLRHATAWDLRRER
jgi:hypothetical protein